MCNYMYANVLYSHIPKDPQSFLTQGSHRCLL
jgi:hypothetical protein